MSSPVKIGRYQVVGHLATGGMAEILLGKLIGPSGFERPVVIKRILPNLVQQKSFVDMFLDEAKVVARIQHPNVVHVHELGTEDGELYLVMEYLEGETALNLLRRAKKLDEPLHPVIAAHIVGKAAGGLHAAHELRDEQGELVRLVHRDVSPHNIFITYSGAVKVLDFGIAKHDERDTATEAGQLKGKFPYMSPEQCLGKEVDRRSDVFSLGIVLFELITGKRLFARETTMLTMQAVVNGETLSPMELNPECPPALAAVCDKALQREPKKRYQTAADMRRDIVNAIKSVQYDDIPEEALGAQMHFLFRERVHEKAEMLKRVGAGSQITNVPRAEVDNSVSLPGVDGDRKRVDGSTPFSTESESGSRGGGWGRGFPLLVAAAVLLGIGVGLGIAFGGDDELLGEERALVAASGGGSEGVDESLAREGADETEESTEESPADTAEAPPTEVTLSVSSSPEGALVTLDGEERGVTPLALTLPVGEEPVAVRVSHEGFAPTTQRFVPHADGDIDAVLEALPTQRAERPRREARRSMTARMQSEPATTEMGGSPFRRFN